MKQRTVAIIAFYDEQKRILLQDRYGIAKSGEEWSFFGGGIENGETPEQALKREIKEELNYDIVNYKFFKKYQRALPPDYYVTSYFFLAPFPGFGKLEQHEGKGMKLFTLAEIKKLKILPIDHPIIDELDKFFAAKL